VDVVVIDDHPLFSRGLTLLLPPVSGGRVRVVGTTDDASAGAALVRRHHADVAIVDLHMPPPGGVRAIAAIRRAERLTSDDRRLWRLVAAGTSTVDIATTLHVSERTVKRLVAGLLRQLGVATRVEAAALAGRVGLDAGPEEVERGTGRWSGH
jgi:DNA-binding NarL/FixJ family response regulator